MPRAAKAAREKLLTFLRQVLPGPRDTMAHTAPKVVRVRIPPAEIGRVIGPGGRVIKQIMDETQTTLYIDEGGNVSITGKTREAVEQAKQKVLAIVAGEGSEVPQKAYTLGEAYEAEVVRVLPSGAIVKLLDGTGTLAFVHISEVADFYIKDLSKVLRVGERVKVKLIAFDDQGRLRASIKQAG